MVTRYLKKKGTNQEEMEEIEEMIGGLFEEDPQEDQPENPTQPEPEIEVINQDREREQQTGDTVENPPDKITPTEERQQLMKFMMEQFGQINNNFTKMNETSKKMKEEINENFDEKMDQNREFLKENIELLNNKL